MKEIKAIIQPHRLSAVMSALHSLPHFPGVTVLDCQGQGRGLGAGGRYEPSEESIYFGKKLRLEILCADAICDEIVAVLQKAAHTGNPGDGIITVTDLERVLRIRSGQQQDQAV